MKRRMVMPFGRHKDEYVDELPTDYIEWCLGTLDLQPELQAEMEAQLALKRGEGVSRGKESR